MNHDHHMDHATMNHTGMDHSMMNHTGIDHSMMNHNGMDHSMMGHGNMKMNHMMNMEHGMMVGRPILIFSIFTVINYLKEE